MQLHIHTNKQQTSSSQQSLHDLATPQRKLQLITIFRPKKNKNKNPKSTTTTTKKTTKKGQNEVFEEHLLCTENSLQVTYSQDSFDVSYVESVS